MNTLKKLFILFYALAIIYIVYYVITLKLHFNCKYKVDHLQEGRQFLSTQNVIICGLARNSEKTLLLNKKLINSICNVFNDYRFLVVENDSTDNTRNLLLSWAYNNNKVRVLGCDGINLPKCVLNLEHFINHEHNTRRIKKMAYLRNIYLDEIKKSEYMNFNYVIVWDLDIEGDIKLDGLYDIGYKLKHGLKMDAICANGIASGRYYDTYAFRKKDSWTLPKGMFDFLYTRPYDCENVNTKELYEVKSCFGGFTIYNRNSIINKRYGTYTNIYGDPICEHQYLNENLNKVYQSSNFLYYVDKM